MEELNAGSALSSMPARFHEGSHAPRAAVAPRGPRPYNMIARLGRGTQEPAGADATVHIRPAGADATVHSSDLPRRPR
jgi:hypothetical protein